MIKYLLASHRNFADGSKSFLEFMIGKTYALYTLNAFMDDADLNDQIKDTFEEIGDFEQLIIFCDIHGGSVEQAIFKYIYGSTQNIKMISGYNLALVLEIMIRNKVMDESELLECIKSASNSICMLAKDEKSDSSDDSLF